MENSRSFEIFGISVLSLPSGKVAEFLEALLDKNSRPVQIITLNLDFLRIASEDLHFREICRSAGYVLPDGMGVVYLIKRKYGIKVNRVTGNDLLLAALSLSFRRKIRLAFAGSEPLVLSMLKERIQREYPQAEITALISPPLSFEEDPLINLKIINELSRAHPDILFLALGCSRQEKWLHTYKDAIGAGISIGIGAAFDYFTGYKKRAPLIMQRMSMEWFWRFLLEPRRLFKRYFIKDIPFIISQKRARM